VQILNNSIQNAFQDFKANLFSLQLYTQKFEKGESIKETFWLTYCKMEAKICNFDINIGIS